VNLLLSVTVTTDLSTPQTRRYTTLWTTVSYR